MGCQTVADLLFQLRDIPIQRFDLPHQHPQPCAVMPGNEAVQRFFQFLAFATQVPGA